MTTLRALSLLVAIVACGPPVAAADLAGMIGPAAGAARPDAAARESAVPDGRCVAIRLQWGGGTPRAWSVCPWNANERASSSCSVSAAPSTGPSGVAEICPGASPVARRIGGIAANAPALMAASASR